ncbi:MAG TPA: glycerol-3-phosphate dehydrogenase/oxidase [Chryseosolibacter sp.]|nr:glycerol-3-phosphate dehydrogenase/oxidase [Chryseosolibacter sp.]
MNFSITNRSVFLEKLKNDEFDLLIIGGGITGAGIALDAASRGLKTALIEQNDFAFGTSSRSTKLIHGGLRYLKQLEFGLVKEVGSERAIVHRLATHLVIPERMLLPLSEKKGLGYWLTSIGLMVYDFLAGVRPKDQRRMLTRKKTLKYEPLLKADDIKGGAIYAEYRTDDARLTIEIIKKAFEYGATPVSYVRCIGFINDSGKVCGANAIDEFHGNPISIRAKVVVNAAGPWVDELRDINQSRNGKRLHLTKGVHVVVPREKFPVRQSIYFDVDDGRMIFAIPRGRATYVGTTDTTYNGRLNEVYTTIEDAEYLVKAVNTTFPKVNLQVYDIESSWAGLRPLIHEEGKSASQLSRKDEIFESPSCLISIAGGKLTGYRKMSERVVNLVIKKYLKEKYPPCFTNRIRLGGNDFKSAKRVNRYIEKLKVLLRDFDLPDHTASYLVHNYGKQTDIILEIFKNAQDTVDVDLRLLQAELTFTIEHEMVITLRDFFIRRTGLVYFNIARVSLFQKEIVKLMQSRLGWDESRVNDELNSLSTYINHIKQFN